MTKTCPFDNPYCENFYMAPGPGPDTGLCADCEDALEAAAKEEDES